MNRKIKFIDLDPSLAPRVSEICNVLGLEICEKAENKIRISTGGSLAVSEKSGEIVLSYKKQHEIWRALSFLPRFLEDKKEVSQNALYNTLCYMADMSRNAVYNLDSAKRMIRYLAVMGYDSLMLYTEDTYELPDYKYFGHMRGRFSEAELKEIDDYAFGFGIEVIPCVQVLAHLETAIRWPDFDSFRDTDKIILVGSEKTYKFVDDILAQCAKCFRSRRINLGMDEAHNLGLGNYLTANGYKKASDIMIDHLTRLIPICEKYGFSPMMWSDMFFRMAFNGKYYVNSGEIPPEVVAKVPSGLTLIYWDYYSTDTQRVDHMVSCHKKFANPVAFAGGAWKWYGFGTHNRYSLLSSKVQLDVTDKYGVTDIIVTSWGDDGGEASQFSTLASLLFFAERSYTREVDANLLDMRSKDCFDTSFEDLLAFDLPNELPGCETTTLDRPANPCKYLLYNDLFEGFMDSHVDPNTAPAAYAKNAARLFDLKDNKSFGYAFETLARLCAVLELKSDLGIRIREAYRAGNRSALEKIAKSELTELTGRIKAFLASFRAQWYKENKTFGFSAQELRIGGLIARVESAELRLNSYLAGEISAIEELETEVLPVKKLPKDATSPYIPYNNWKNIVSAGVM